MADEPRYRGMRFLVQGIGSIGQRHYRNLITLGHEVAIVRSNPSKRPFVEAFFADERAHGREPEVFLSLQEAVKEYAPAALVVAVPNHLHLAAAKEALESGLHVFIEKPVHHTLEGIDHLIALARERGKAVMVGYNMRFHPLLVRVKSMLADGECGKVVSASVEVGENIADWHPWEDYRDTYAPYIRSGGGSLLCFSHDIDYLYWLLGSPQRISAAGGKVTPLEGDAEDLVQGLWHYADGKTAIVHIDYWQRPKVRTLKIIGTRKTLVWDAYAALTIWDHESGEKEVVEVPAGFERNHMFIEEMRHFVACIEEGRAPGISLEDGREVVSLVEQMKKAIASNL